MFRRVQNLIMPAIFVLFPFVALTLHNRRALVYDLLFYAPYVLLAMAGLLGLKLNQRKIFLASLLFAATYAGLRATRADIELFARAASVGVPLALFLLFHVPEARFKSVRGGLSFVVTLLPLFVIYFIGRTDGLLTDILLYRKWPIGAALVPLSDVGLMLAMGFLLATTWGGRARGMITFRLYVAVAFVPVYFALARAVGGTHTLRLELALSFLSAGALLIYGVFCLYWEKVFIDDLTEVPNRRALNDRMAILSGHYTIAMVDIDFFKAFNDNFGHAEGDDVLRLVAKSLERGTGGRAYRYGGEEFAVLFEDTTAPQAKGIMEVVRKKLADTEFCIRVGKETREQTSEKDRNACTGRESRKTRVTVSVGIAPCTAMTRRPEDVMGNADRALYYAKALGRNRVVVDRERPTTIAGAGGEKVSILQALLMKRSS